MRFTQPQQNANLYVIGSDWGPSQIPMSAVMLGGDSGQYAYLFSFTGPDGETVRSVYPGSYGTVVPARKGR